LNTLARWVARISKYCGLELSPVMRWNWNVELGLRAEVDNFVGQLAESRNS
jgi:hypothetical protein